VRVGQSDRPLRGVLRVPGDKSVSHRAVILASAASGVSRLTGVLSSEDLWSTIEAIRGLGVTVEILDEGSGRIDMVVTGWGEDGPQRPAMPIDCGNSGTTTRLLSGLVAGWDVEVGLIGDDSLSSRPMERIASPLRGMGADVETGPSGTLPLTIHGGDLRPISYVSDVASAQVKSAILLAGLRAPGRTCVTEPALSRDHTERMFRAFSVPSGTDPALCTAWVDGPAIPVAIDLEVPGDPSSAAFFACAALLIPGSELEIIDLSLNPTRIGWITVLERMGADIVVSPNQESGGEISGTVHVKACDLHATQIGGTEIPGMIDEVPILAVIATQAVGTTRFRDIGELRVKESDRLEAIGDALGRMGADVQWGEDWLDVTGPTPLHGTDLDSLGDHRLAMSFHVAGLIASGMTHIDRYEAVDVSYPGFSEDLYDLLASGPS